MFPSGVGEFGARWLPSGKVGSDGGFMNTNLVQQIGAAGLQCVSQMSPMTATLFVALLGIVGLFKTYEFLTDAVTQETLKGWARRGGITFEDDPMQGETRREYRQRMKRERDAETWDGEGWRGDDDDEF